MYVVKWWHALETSVMPHVSSACHHFTTYIVVKHDTCFKHTFRSRQALTLASVSSVDHQYSYLHVQSLYVFHGILNTRHLKCLVFKIPWIPWKSREFPKFQKIPWLFTLNSKKFPDFSLTLTRTEIFPDFLQNSLTLKIFCFSLTGWQPWNMHGTHKKVSRYSITGRK